MSRIFWIYFIILLFFAKSVIAQENGKHDHSHNEASLKFIQNKNQWQDNILYRADLPSGALFLEKDGFTYNFYDGEALANVLGKNHKNKTGEELSVPEASIPAFVKFHAIKAVFKNYNPNVRTQHINPGNEYFNYFIGKDRSKWASEVYGYSHIKYDEIYKGIDLKLYTAENNLKYDFIIEPGADPSQISIEYQGADNLKIENENFIIKTSVNEIAELKPYAYQVIQGKQIPVACKFALIKNILSFQFPGGYDKSKELIIDPVLMFSTYSGSTANNFGYTATSDSKGFLYSGSSVFGVGYPTVVGSYDLTFNGGIIDYAISKYDTSGTFLVYSTYIGGSGDELPHSLIIDPLKDELLIFGTTNSSDYPTTEGAYDTTFNGGTPLNLLSGLGVNYASGSDIVITRLATNGNKLISSTYVGGSGNDGLNSMNNAATGMVYHPLKYNYADEIRGEIMLDDDGNIYVVSCTKSVDFPIVGSTFQQNYGGGNLDGVVFKIDSKLSTLVWSSYIGGSDVDAAFGIVMDSNNDLYITGGTKSADFPSSPNSVYPNFGGGRADGFITHISKTGGQILKSTFYASPAYDQSYLIQVDRDDNVFVVGQTQAPGNTFIENAAYNTPGAGQFITKFNSSLDSVIWSTRFGTNIGVPNISPVAFLVDLCNKIYLSGWGGDRVNGFGGTNGMDVTPDAFQSTTDNNDFYLFVMEDDASDIYYGSFFGGPQAAEHVDGGTSRFDRMGKIYQSVCAGCFYGAPTGYSDFPIFPNPGAVSPTNNSHCNNAVFKFDFSLPEVLADFDFPISGCPPHSVDFNNTSVGGKAYSWDFGDGNTSTETNPTHLYTTPGVYEIMLVAFDTVSCNFSDTAIKSLMVLGDSTYNYPDLYACGGSAVQIGLPNFNADSIAVQWTPTTGLSDSTIINPYAQPDTTTDYTLVISINGCFDTINQSVIVIPQSIEAFTDSSICRGDTMTISATGNGAYNTFTFSTSPDFSNPIYQGTDSAINVLPNDPITYYVKGENDYCYVTDIVKVYVVKDTSYSLEPLYTCTFDSVKIGINPIPGNNFTYTWNPGTNLSDSTIAQPWASNDTTTTYQLIISNGQCADTISQTVKVLTFQFTPQPAVSTCQGTPVQIGFDIEPDPGLQYLWFPSTGLSSDDIPNPFASPSQSTTYFLYFYNGKCWDLFQFRVNVFPLSVIKNPDMAICKGDSVTITGGSSQFYTDYIWSSNLQFTDTLNNSTNDTTLTIAINQSATFYLQASNQQCIAIDSIKIDVINDTTITFSQISLCKGDTATIGIAPLSGTNVTYEWIPSYGLSDSTISNPIAGPDSTVNYILIISNGTCNDTVYQELEVSPISIASSGDTTICEGSVVTLSAFGEPNSSYIWSTNANFSDTLNLNLNDSTLDVSPEITTTYYVMAILQQCQAVDTIKVTVLNDSLISAQPIAICKGNKTSIGISPLPGNNITYSWTPGNGISDTSISNPFAAPDSTTFYQLIISNGMCSDTLVYEVKVIRDTMLNLMPQYICGTGSIEIGFTDNDFQNLTYSWTPAEDLSNPSISNPIGFVDSSTLFTLVLSNQTCSDTFTQSVTVYPLDILTVTPDSTICKGTGFTLSASTNGVYSAYQWSSNSNFSDTLNTSLSDSTLTANPDTAAIYYVRSTIEQCAIIDSVRINVISNELYTLAPVSICENGSVQIGIQPLIGNGVTYLWRPGNNLSDSLSTPVIANPVSDEIYTLIISNGVCSDTLSQEIDVKSFSLSKINDTTFCIGNDITLSASSNVDATYYWFYNSNFVDTLNTPAFDSAITVNQVGKYHIECVYLGCSKTDSVIISASSVNINTSGKIICEEDSTWLKVTNLNPADTLSYIWSPANNIIGSNTSDSILINPNSTMTYYVSAQNKFGCADNDSALIIVSNLNSTNFTIDAEPDSIYKGASTTLSVSPANGYSLTWNPASSVDNINATVTQANPESSTTYTIRIIDGNCEKLDSVSVYVYEIICGEPDIYIPNAFTPNDDNVNDQVYVRGNNIKEMYLTIYNRWGEMIFETKEQNKGWNGTYKGMLADPGVFVYYLTVTCVDDQTYFVKGNITLIK